MLFSQFQRSQDQKYYRKSTKEIVFVYIFGFIFYDNSHAKTDLHNIYIRLFHRKDFKLQKYGGTGLISEKKTEPLFAKLNEEAEAVSCSYSATGIFYNVIILCFWLRTIERSE